MSVSAGLIAKNRDLVRLVGADKGDKCPDFPRVLSWIAQHWVNIAAFSRKDNPPGRCGDLTEGGPVARFYCGAMTQARRRDALVMLLTAGAGAANVLSLTALGGVPASVMTANLVLVGLSITRHQGTLGWHAGAALAAFALGVVLTSRLTGKQDADRPVWPRRVTVAVAAEALPLIGVAVGWGLADGRPTGALQLVLCAVTAFAMGIQSMAVRALGVAGLSSTFFTGQLTDALRDLAGPAPHRWTRGATGVVALLAGAAAQGAVLAGGQRFAPLLPLALTCCVAVLSARGFSRAE
jgi:uncharacterized membrane protein YoaK (UPF0700 family)